MMIYNNNSIRRQDRTLEQADALRLLQRSEYGVLSLQSEEGGAYGIPINYVWDGKDSLYLHCAPEGRKLKTIAQCNKISFCIVGAVHLLPNKFTTEYESIVLCGTAHISLPEEERRKAIKLILDKFSPDYKESGAKYAEKSFHRTEIIRLDIAQWSGKRKGIPK